MQCLFCCGMCLFQHLFHNWLCHKKSGYICVSRTCFLQPWAAVVNPAVAFLVPVCSVPVETAMNHANFGPFQCCWFSVRTLTCVRKEHCMPNQDTSGLGLHFESQLLKCQLKPQRVGWATAPCFISLMAVDEYVVWQQLKGMKGRKCIFP